MALRLRRASGRWVAYCAASVPAEVGDVYIDDGQHYAIYLKMRNYLTTRKSTDIRPTPAEMEKH